ncbi:polysaccharide deacetylase family protein [Mesobacillus maritimus]|uniref:polysaccharide deacetylase family protein n=1 Tax=Mesobacillus maritimus TaxID=1643336 RepID=UPI00203C65F1|nr:polysaccharide deacetylase family protein [Mesobacillus maritimus]MCM3586748.1 polysaccharide deacetylase family protein [Mesobacillus maritimus]MCM3668497.1 polysaccharide deacetylase family protein [Mesobacillus maritimus]
MKKFIIISSIIFLFIIIGYGLFQLSKSRTFQLFGGLVTNVDTTEKLVALTFDDGPGIRTNEILTILEEEDVKATFYLTGSEIDEQPEAAAKIAQKGHEIGNHSYSHQRMVLKSPTFIKEEIEKTDELIRQTGYTGEIHFRPPFGKRLLFLPYYLSQNDRKTILWDVEPETYPDIAADANKIADHVINHVKPGSIVLLHVMYESRQESIDAVREIIIGLRAEGYKVTTISELLEYKS